jgi:hypothetical protein
MALDLAAIEGGSESQTQPMILPLFWEAPFHAQEEEESHPDVIRNGETWMEGTCRTIGSLVYRRTSQPRNLEESIRPARR